MSNSELSLIVNGDYTVIEKLKMLDEYKSKVLSEITDAKMEVKSGYTYCEKCKQWYKKKAWEEETVREKREFCSFMPLAEWEQPEYDVGDFMVQYQICPMGHKRELTSYPT